MASVGVIPSILVTREVVPIPGTVRSTLAARDGTLRADTVPLPLSGPIERLAPAPRTPECFFDAVLRSPLEETWFEVAHVFPRSLELGNILSEVTNEVVIFNAFRDQSITWSAVANNAGDGITLTGTTPPPGVVIESNDGVGLTLTVSPIGPPTINGTVDFTFLGLYTVPISITGSRLVVFAFVPERPIRERLEWLTDVLEAADGSEQRIALRGNPRQIMTLDYFREEGTELTEFDNVVFDWQARVFGVPVWWEPTTLAADVSSGGLTIQVASTAFADYRVGGLAIVFESESVFDVLEVESFDGSSITFKSPLGNSYASGAEVMPVRTCRMTSEVQGSRARRGRATRRVVFRVTDNNVGDGFADTSAFSEYASRVLLDDPNAVDGELRETTLRRLIEQDAGVGLFTADTPWPQPKRTTAKGFRPKSRQALWGLRRLLHGLRGRQVSFWLPTFYRDLVVSDTVQGSTAALVIEAAGFSRFVSTTRPNRSVIRLEDTSGGQQVRVITGATALTGGRESVTVDAAWDAGDLDPSAVSRITFFELVRQAQDSVEILHRDQFGQADVSIGAITVFDS